MGGKTNQKKNNGRNESHHKKKEIIPNLSASQTKYLGTESFVQLVTCVNNRNLVW